MEEAESEAHYDSKRLDKTKKDSEEFEYWDKKLQDAEKAYWSNRTVVTNLYNVVASLHDGINNLVDNTIYLPNSGDQELLALDLMIIHNQEIESENEDAIILLKEIEQFVNEDIEDYNQQGKSTTALTSFLTETNTAIQNATAQLGVDASAISQVAFAALNIITDGKFATWKQEIAVVEKEGAQANELMQEDEANIGTLDVELENEMQQNPVNETIVSIIQQKISALKISYQQANYQYNEDSNEQHDLEREIDEAECDNGYRDCRK